MTTKVKKPVLGLDIDGVCYQWDKTARFLLKHQFGHHLMESCSWDYIKENIPNNSWQWLWTAGVAKGLFRHGHLFNGVIEALRDIEQHYRIELITSRPETAWQDTREWVAFHKIPAAALHLLGPNEPKSQVPADVYIDDALTNVAELVANTKAKVLLMDRPWNRVTGSSGIRVHGWAGVHMELLS